MPKKEYQSRTKRDTTWVERWITGGDQSYTTISGDGRKVSASGRTAEESQRRASNKWRNRR